MLTRHVLDRRSLKWALFYALLHIWTWIISRINRPWLYKTLRDSDWQPNVKLAQLVRHPNRSQEVLDSIPTGSNYLLKIFCSSLQKPLLATLPPLYNVGKTQLKQINFPPPAKAGNRAGVLKLGEFPSWSFLTWSWNRFPVLHGTGTPMTKRQTMTENITFHGTTKRLLGGTCVGGDSVVSVCALPEWPSRLKNHVQLQCIIAAESTIHCYMWAAHTYGLTTPFTMLLHLLRAFSQILFSVQLYHLVNRSKV